MTFGALHSLGVLGINARIGHYMNRYNPRKYYPFVDDKIKTSALAEQHEIKIPKTYHIFDSYGELRNLSEILKPYEAFVIKPAKGAMGHGIVVIDRVDKELFIKPSGKQMTLQQLRDHISQIMSGLYSLSGTPDEAIIQYKVKLHPAFHSYTYQGIPDVRVIVYRGYPVMAMTRLPTRESDGRANLHQGSIGAGLNMTSGKVTYAIHHNHFIHHHPDTSHTLDGLEIPYWQEILITAARCYDIVHMGYLGVDIVVDEIYGSLMLEMNARPGLSIQVANRKGLKKILNNFEKMITRQLPAEERVKLALSQFQG